MPEEESAALATLMAIEGGDACLAGGEHTWCEYNGTRGSGRICTACLTVQDAKGGLVWRVGPTLPAHVEPTATALLALWQRELARCGSGGCISGGEHAWVDATQSAVRLSGPGRCCSRCGAVVDVASGRAVVRPNLLGRFGPPTTPAYRGERNPSWLRAA